MMPQDSEEALNGEAETETAEAEDAESLRQALGEAQQKAEEYLANWQRAQADFINYKRRTEQERQDVYRLANANLILSLLPILDDLERALDSVPSTRTTKQGLVEGVRLVERNFRSAMEAQGLTTIKALGEPFDPNFHEALRQDRGEEGIVIEEYQKGYLLGDRVLRPAKVVVGNGLEAAGREEPAET